MINLPLAGWNVRSIKQITAEGKSPACEDPGDSSEQYIGGFGQSGHKKTRPSAQYNAKRPCQPRTLKSACAAR
jgi:hypothetical protein